MLPRLRTSCHDPVHASLNSPPGIHHLEFATWIHHLRMKSSFFESALRTVGTASQAAEDANCATICERKPVTRLSRTYFHSLLNRAHKSQNQQQRKRFRTSAGS